MSHPVCSVIIPAYNYGHYIDKCINSVLAQTYPYKEIIVVDDGSTDNTPEVVKQFDNSIIYHRKKNAGIAAAWNTGLSLCTGKYIQFLDADDTLSPDKLETQVAFLESNPDIDIVYSDYLFVDPDGNSLTEQTKGYMGTGLVKDDNVLQRLIRANFITVHCTLMRSEIIKTGFRFDAGNKKINEDWDFWLRLAAKGYKFQYCHGPVAYYLKHGNSVTSSNRVNHDRTLDLLNKVKADRNLLGEENSKLFIAVHSRGLASNHYNFKEWKLSQQRLLEGLKTNWSNGGGWQSVLLFIKAGIHRLISVVKK